METHELTKFKNSKDLGKWYDQKYTEMGGGWKVGQEEALRIIDWAEFAVDSGMDLLDIGCGDGDFIYYVCKYFQCWGIDLSAVGIKHAEKLELWPGTAFTVEDIEDTNFVSESFNYLTSLGSIEHCISIPKALAQCYRIMKNDGKFFVLVPNELWQHFDQPQETTHTDKEWAKLFTDAGFKIVKKNRRQDLTDFLLVKDIK
jgi:ubiquinone/menaquinone biosynthesis C-methylase UbiE